MTDEPVYFGGVVEKCRVTVGQFYLMMLTLFARHGLTKPALADFMEAIKVLLPAGVTIKTSFHKLLSRYNLLSTTTRRVFYCDVCHKKVATASGPLPCQCKKGNRSFMVLLDVREELQRRLQGLLLCLSIV